MLFDSLYHGVLQRGRGYCYVFKILIRQRKRELFDVDRFAKVGVPRFQNDLFLAVLFRSLKFYHVATLLSHKYISSLYASHSSSMASHNVSHSHFCMIGSSSPDAFLITHSSRLTEFSTVTMG